MKLTNIIRDSYGNRAQSHHLKPMLGIDAKAKLPANGMNEKIIQGVAVYIMPLDPNRGRYHKTHRVMAICPVCDKHVSAGRLAQHVIVHKAAAPST